jgi:hypothetical protein
VRKLVLIAAFALASVAAQAAERIDRVPAENDAPVAAAPPAAEPPAAATPAPAQPQASEGQASRKEVSRTQFSRAQISRAQPSGMQAFRSRKSLRATHERQARRIAATYGISW